MTDNPRGRPRATPDDTPAGEIGQRIRAAREAAGLTIDELADLLGKHPDSVRLWERGRTLPPLVLLPVLCEVLGCGVEAIIPEGD